MTMIVDAPLAERSLHVARHEGMELRAVIEGDSVYPQVTDSRDGTVQYPAWNPIDGEFEFWDDLPSPLAQLALTEAWTTTLRHPSLAFAA